MKRIISLTLAALALASTLAFAGCGGKFTCDTCLQEKSGKKHTEEMFGVEITMCNDCYKATQGAADALAGMLG